MPRCGRDTVEHARGSNGQLLIDHATEFAAEFECDSTM
jgi:hypothetical protein